MSDLTLLVGGFGLTRLDQVTRDYEQLNRDTQELLQSSEALQGGIGVDAWGQGRQLERGGRTQCDAFAVAVVGQLDSQAGQLSSRLAEG